MELYREYKVNPLGRCLPLLVQLPILFALYGAITYGLGATPYQVVDLSGRLLIPGLDTLVPLDKLWLGLDLTQPPTVAGFNAAAIILPLLVLVSTWLQSKLTIPALDPNDKNKPAASMTRSMTTIMPLMFGFFALTFSVGLAIYFIVSNVVGIIQYTLLCKAHWNQVVPGLVSAKQTGKPVISVEQQSQKDAILARVIQKIESTPRNPALASRASSGRVVGPVLELGCGSGRVLLPLARAGQQVVGLDNSPAMLARAWQKLAAEVASGRVRLVEGNMAHFELGEAHFGLAIVAYNTFLPP